MLKVLLFPFYIIRAIWSLLPLLAEFLYALINGFSSLAQALNESSEKANKASRDLLEEARERRFARAKEIARLQRELDECTAAVHPGITRSKTQTVASTSGASSQPDTKAVALPSTASRVAPKAIDASNVAELQPLPRRDGATLSSHQNGPAAEFNQLREIASSAFSRAGKSTAAAIPVIDPCTASAGIGSQSARTVVADRDPSTEEKTAGKDFVKLRGPTRTAVTQVPAAVGKFAATAQLNVSASTAKPSVALVSGRPATPYVGDQPGLPQKAQQPSSSLTTSTGSMGVASLQLVLFDLDGTLLRTDDLEQFRGRSHLGPQPPAYLNALTEAFLRGGARWIYRQQPIADLIKACPGVKFGVFTRSPAVYAHRLLELGFPDVQWDVVVAFEDVRRTKPYGDGVLHAMRLVDVSDPGRVVLVGDDTTDIQAAYHAGCLAFLETSAWSEHNERALEKIPDAKVKGPHSLLHALRSLPERLPSLESALFLHPQGRPSSRVDAVLHPGPEGRKLVVHVAGRLFVESQELAMRRHQHRLTQSILENKKATKFPESWIAALSSFLRAQLSRHTEIVVTVIPGKHGRAPRLESLLRQLEQQTPIGFRKKCHFVPDLLKFSEVARSHSGEHLSRQQRMANARDTLFINFPERAIDRDVLVIDDVVTSGATFFAAESKLVECGARSVTCFAMAKSVRFS